VLKELIKIANNLDDRGLVREADVLDLLLKRAVPIGLIEFADPEEEKRPKEELVEEYGGETSFVGGDIIKRQKEFRDFFKDISMTIDLYIFRPGELASMHTQGSGKAGFMHVGESAVAGALTGAASTSKDKGFFNKLKSVAGTAKRIFNIIRKRDKNNVTLLIASPDPEKAQDFFTSSPGWLLHDVFGHRDLLSGVVEGMLEVFTIFLKPFDILPKDVHDYTGESDADNLREELSETITEGVGSPTRGHFDLYASVVAYYLKNQDLPNALKETLSQEDQEKMKKLIDKKFVERVRGEVILVVM